MTNEGLVPISNFVNLEPVQKVSTIRRVDGIPVKEIRANVAPGVLADDKVKEIITKIKLEEAVIAHKQNAIEGAAPQVSVAT